MSTKEFFRKIRFYRINKINKKHSRGRTLICNNCTGAMVLHDSGLRFNTPTVNLFMYPEYYIEYLENLQYYLNTTLEDITNDSSYPIGLLGKNVRIDFLHYPSFVKALTKWKQRSTRVDLENLYIVLVERDGCTEDILFRFDKLPYKNKVALVHKPYPKIKCAYVMPNCAEENQLRQIIDYKGHLGNRYYDLFNWTNFLNIKIEK